MWGTGGMGSRGMEHMGNRPQWVQGYGVQVYGATGGMGHIGNGSHGQWGTWSMGHMGHGAHGQWGPWAIGTLLLLSPLLLDGFLQKFYCT